LAALNLIPKHVLLSESESKKVIKKLDIPVEKLPKISETDPQAKAINAKAGSIIEVSREDPTGKYSQYRYVVN